MTRFIIFIFIVTLSFNTSSNENLLTIQQQIDRLQREVSDLSKSAFANSSEGSISDNQDTVNNLSAIDMRIYDLEKDVKKINENIEEILFQLDDMLIQFDILQKSFSSFETNKNSNENTITGTNDNFKKDQNLEKINQENLDNENSLGTLKIGSTENNKSETANNLEEVNKSEENVLETENNVSPEDQFQIAFDNIRKQKYEDAIKSFQNFITMNPDNQLSGSAHYWLGELYLLEKKYRDAALIFAEGFQSYPKSIKAPDMLLKLSESLIEVDKKNESCKTLDKFVKDFPNHKLLKRAKTKIKNYGCVSVTE